MYQITYQKRNGDIFNRERFTLPKETIGEQTSMGWIVLDIKRYFNGKYYSSSEYHQLFTKWSKRNAIIRKIQRQAKRYLPNLATIVVFVSLIEIIIK